MPKVCIIGAGITGLATAWNLQRHGADCTVLEASSKVGGSIQTIHQDDFLCESGPNSIQLNDPLIENFLKSIPGLEKEIIEAEPAAKKRFLVRDGRVLPVPMGPIAALTTQLWSLKAKLRVLKEPFISKAPLDVEESVADFVRRRLGNELYEYAINPLVGGIYAGNPESLSLKHAFPKLHQLEQTHSSLIKGGLSKSLKQTKTKGFKKRIISFREGLDTLPLKIYHALGNKVRTNASIEAIVQKETGWEITCNDKSEYFDQLIVTIPSHHLKNLPFPNELLKELSPLDAIDYPPVSVLNLGFKKSAIKHPLDGFGVLVPECEQKSILGVLFPSSFFNARAPKDHALLTVFVGGERQPHLSSSDLDAVMATVLPDLESLLGVTQPPVMQRLTHWPKAIPQYKLGYQKIFDQINTIERSYKNLHLAGNYRHGISLTYCLEAALKAKL